MLPKQLVGSSKGLELHRLEPLPVALTSKEELSDTLRHNWNTLLNFPNACSFFLRIWPQGYSSSLLNWRDGMSTMFLGSKRKNDLLVGEFHLEWEEKKHVTGSSIFWLPCVQWLLERGMSTNSYVEGAPGPLSQLSICLSWAVISGSRDWAPSWVPCSVGSLLVLCPLPTSPNPAKAHALSLSNK